MAISKSIKTICVFVLLFICSAAQGRDYAFSVTEKDAQTNASYVYTLLYANNRVTVKLTVTILGVFDTGILAEYNVKSPTMNSDGTICFKNNAGAIVATVHASAYQKPGSIIYKNEKGGMSEVSTQKVSTDFWQNYCALRQTLRPNNTPSNTNTKPQASRNKPQSQRPQQPKPVPPAKPKRPAEIPAGINIASDSDFGASTPQNSSNCTLLKKEGKKIDMTRPVVFANLVAHPLGIKQLTWCDKVTTMLKEVDNTGLWLRGYYNYRNNYGFLDTKVFFLGDVFLDLGFNYNSIPISFRCNNLQLMFSSKDGYASIHTFLMFNLHYDVRPVSGSKDMKKFNKELLKQYHNFITELQRQGYNFIKDKDSVSKERYTAQLPDGKTCIIDIQLFGAGEPYNEYISIDIGRFNFRQ